jgi:Tfp pilus assembly protein PilO
LIALFMGVLALLIVLATGLYVVLTPFPKAPSAVAKQDSERKIRKEIEDAKSRTKELNAEINRHTWSIPQDEVGPAALAKVASLAKARNLKLTAFRPQKTAVMDGLTQMPFLILVDGPFPSVVQFMKDINRTDTKLAVTVVQMASADEASDRVTATIGAAAYWKPKTKGATVGKNL